MINLNFVLWTVGIMVSALGVIVYLGVNSLRSQYNKKIEVEKEHADRWKMRFEEAKRAHPKPKYTMTVYVGDDEERKLLCGIIATNGYKVWTGDTVVEQTTVYVEELDECS